MGDHSGADFRPNLYSCRSRYPGKQCRLGSRCEAVRRLQENLKNRRSVLPTLELAARLNREIGLGSEDRPPGITITFVSNLRPGALRRGHEAAPRLPARPDGTREDGAR